MAETFTFLATRGSIQTYAGGTLKAIALDATVIDNEDPGVNNVTDIESAEVTGGTYTRPTLTGNSWDTSGAWPSLLADDLLVEGLDDTVGTVAVFDNASGSLLFGVRFDPVAVTGDLPINWPGGVALTVEPPASLTLDDLTDVNTAGRATGDAPVWNGTEWVPGVPGSWGDYAVPADLPAPSGTPAWVDFTSFGLPPLQWARRSDGMVELTGASGYLSMVDDVPTPAVPTPTYRGATVVFGASPNTTPRCEQLTPVTVITCETTMGMEGPEFGPFLPGFGFLSHDGALFVGMGDPTHNTFNISATFPGAPLP